MTCEKWRSCQHIFLGIFLGIFLAKMRANPHEASEANTLRPSWTTLVMVAEGLDSGASQGDLPSLAECRMQRDSGGCSAASQHTKSDWGL